MDFNEIKIRCSALGKIMTDTREGSGLTDKQTQTLIELQTKYATGKLTDNQETERQRLTTKRDAPPELSDTCKKYLAELWVKLKYGREKDISNRYTTKGLLVEEDSLTLFSNFKDQFFKKNDEQLTNEFITGTPDIIIDLPIEDSDEVIDIKSSWDIFTFFATFGDSLNKLYFWQLQGYMALTGAKRARLAYCLVNTPDALVNDEKRKLQWRMNVIDDTNPEFIEASAKLDTLMTYDDIPTEERVNEILIPRDEKAIAAIYERVKLCRIHLEKTYNLQNKLQAA